MLGIDTPYALGHDVFSTDDHFVVFPNTQRSTVRCIMIVKMTKR